MTVFGVAATVAVFWVCRAVYRRWTYTLLSPMLTSVLGVIGLLLVLRVPYPAYMTGGHWLSALLQPATVAFAVPLYRHREALIRHARALLTGLTLGSVMAVISSLEFARATGLPGAVVRSLAPRSITTPVAMSIAQATDANPVLAAVFVLCTGILGVLIGPWLVRLLRLRTFIGRGALMGMGAHGIGTARAFEMGPQEGTISSLSMVVAALAGVVIIPLLLRVMG
ncbi:MAG: LrgB family protein [Alicyclobacillus sp.]|nr:LrgB family protein [Alicyclobacillus sp.]